MNTELSQEALKNDMGDIVESLLVSMSDYDKFIHAGLIEAQAADICALCENVNASDNVKNLLAQSILRGCVGKEDYRAMYEECPEMFSSLEQAQEDMRGLNDKSDPSIVRISTPIDYFLKSLNYDMDEEIPPIKQKAITLENEINRFFKWWDLPRLIDTSDHDKFINALIAGEDLKQGDAVIQGKDKKIYKAKHDSIGEGIKEYCNCHFDHNEVHLHVGGKCIKCHKKTNQ